MLSEDAGEKTLLLSLGLFGIPAGQDERDGETRRGEKRDGGEPDEGGSVR